MSVTISDIPIVAEVTIKRTDGAVVLHRVFDPAGFDFEVRVDGQATLNLRTIGSGAVMPDEGSVSADDGPQKMALSGKGSVHDL